MTRSCRYQLLWGATFLMTSIILGALGAHALANILTESQMSSFQTAVRYQQIQGVGILIVAMINAKSELAGAKWIFRLLIIGTALFSGSIYFLVFASGTIESLKPVFGPITPVGGILMILGWLVFIRAIAIYKVSK